MTNLPQLLPTTYQRGGTVDYNTDSAGGPGINGWMAVINALVEILGGPASPLAITGGSLDGVTIGATTPAVSVRAETLALPGSPAPPTATSGEGQLYVASNGDLHYLGPSGTDTRVALA